MYECLSWAKEYRDVEVICKAQKATWFLECQNYFLSYLLFYICAVWFSYGFVFAVVAGYYLFFSRGTLCMRKCLGLRLPDIKKNPTSLEFYWTYYQIQLCIRPLLHQRIRETEQDHQKEHLLYKMPTHQRAQSHTLNLCIMGNLDTPFSLYIILDRIAILYTLISHNIKSTDRWS